MSNFLYHYVSNAIGIVGVTMVLLAYFFSQTGKLSIDSFLYSFSNLIGAVLIVFSLIFHWNLSSFIIEIAWFGISAMGLVRVFLKKKQSSKFNAKDLENSGG